MFFAFYNKNGVIV